MGHEIESLLLGLGCAGGGVLILCLARALEGSVILIALLFLLVGMTFIVTNTILLRDKVVRKRQLERGDEARRAREKQLEELEAREQAGLITKAEYRAERKELLKDQ